MNTLLRILLITSHCPGAPAYGAQLRALHIGRLLKRLGKVSLIIVKSSISYIDQRWIEKTNKEFNLIKVIDLVNTERLSILERIKNGFDPNYLNTFNQVAKESDVEYVKKEISNYDIIWLHSIRIPNSFQIWHWPNSILDVDDFQSQIYFTSAKNTNNIFDKLNCMRMSKIWKVRESIFLKRFSSLSVCSDSDRNYLGRSENKIFVVPNGFEIPAYKPSNKPSIDPIIGFIGTFDYSFNVSGVEWFVKHVWPIIKKRVPGIRFRIIGKNSDAHPIAKKEENIECLGWVEDPALEMSKWSLMIVPVHVGGGTRIKIPDAFSKGIPVVSTTLGAYGYDVTHGTEILLGDTPDSFAEMCVLLIREKDIWYNISINAWNKFINNYTWESYFPNVQAIIKSIIG